MWFRILLPIFLMVPFMAMPQVLSLETQGNLAPTHKVGCVDLAGAKAEYSPADLAPGVVACAKNGDFDEAADLFVVMLLRARYDSKRVEDKTAHQAGQVIALQIRGALGAGEMENMEAALKVYGGGSARHQMMCREMKRIGPPDYYPAYMIKHGMSAVLGRDDEGITKGFRSKLAWRDLLANYLKCDGA